VTHDNTCPTCDTGMIVTDRHVRGVNSVSAAGGRLEPVHGYVVRARCQNPVCGADWERGDYDEAWQRTK
jgi:hypothetical protein